MGTEVSTLVNPSAMASRAGQAFSCPAVLVAAPASGQGKTTVSAALARLHTRQGRRVRVFKCGPDFLDPYWLALASGAPVHQLDLWMTGEADCRARLHEAAAASDLIIVEGVMGLFDGDPSAADLAQRFGLPVLAVIDASAMAGTFAALAFGLQHYRPGMPWAGVLANRVASDRHASMLQTGLREEAGVPSPWLGALMRNAAFALPERHLGLTVASEVTDAVARLDAAADALATTPLGQMSMADLQRWAVTFTAPVDVSTPTAATAVPLQGRTIAIARDAAFCFVYQANLDVLTTLGATLVTFSPLADTALPPCDAVWLPGGYPELHATTLSQQHALRDSLKAHIAQDKPVWAECGGMMLLFDTLMAADGASHAMWGVLPGKTTVQKRLGGLGPQQLTLGHARDGAPSQILRGHTFHYSVCETTLPEACRTARPDSVPTFGQGEALYHQSSVRASYFHAWFASDPQAAARLFMHETTA
jgi:cobyrinic acid a,c-diamide synthase